MEIFIVVLVILSLMLFLGSKTIAEGLGAIILAILFAVLIINSMRSITLLERIERYHLNPTITEVRLP